MSPVRQKMPQQAPNKLWRTGLWSVKVVTVTVGEPAEAYCKQLLQDWGLNLVPVILILSALKIFPMPCVLLGLFSMLLNCHPGNNIPLEAWWRPTVSKCLSEGRRAGLGRHHHWCNRAWIQSALLISEYHSIPPVHAHICYSLFDPEYRNYIAKLSPLKYLCLLTNEMLLHGLQVQFSQPSPLIVIHVCGVSSLKNKRSQTLREDILFLLPEHGNTHSWFQVAAWQLGFSSHNPGGLEVL